MDLFNMWLCQEFQNDTQKDEYIYILWDYTNMPDIDKTRIKIGFSTDPEMRSRGIITQAGLEYAMLFVSYRIIDTNVKCERIIHNLLSQYRTVGEWFVLSPFEAVKMIESAPVSIHIERSKMSVELQTIACGIKLEEL